MASLIELSALCGTGTAWTGIRFFSCDRYSIKADALAFMGWALLVVEIVLVYIADDLATTGSDLTSNEDPAEHDLRHRDSIIQVAIWIVHFLLLFFLKLSAICFLLRISEYQDARAWVKRALIVAVMAIIASVLAIVLGCLPFYRYWQIAPKPENSCQAAVSRPIVFTSLSSTVATELYLFLIPVKLLWRVQVSVGKRINAIAILNAGILVPACSALKSYYISTASNTQDGTHVAGTWRVREAFIAVVATSLPQVLRRLKIWIRLFFKNPIPPVIRTHVIRTQILGLGTMRGGGRRPDQLGSQAGINLTTATVSTRSIIPSESIGQRSEAC